MALFALAELPAGPGAANALANCDTSTAAMDPEEIAALAAMNAERTREGLSALAVSPNLSRAAAWKSADPSARPPLSHTDSLGRSPIQQPPGNRAIDCGYRT